MDVEDQVCSPFGCIDHCCGQCAKQGLLSCTLNLLRYRLRNNWMAYSGRKRDKNSHILFEDQKSEKELPSVTNTFRHHDCTSLSFLNNRLVKYMLLWICYLGNVEWSTYSVWLGQFLPFGMSISYLKNTQGHATGQITTPLDWYVLQQGTANEGFQTPLYLLI